MYKRIAVVFTMALVQAVVCQSQAAVIYSTPSSTYSQNFDTLPSSPQNVSLGASPAGWTDDNGAPAAGNFSIIGWYLYHPISQSEGGANGHQRMRVGAGTVNTGAFMSFGASGSTERALGDVGSTTLAANPTAPATGTPIYWALRVNNSTGQTLGSFTVSYFGEQWRDGNNTTPEAITVGYTNAAATDATNWADQTAVNGDFTAIPALTFNPPVTANNDAAVDGNVAGRSPSALTATITGLNWASGTDLWIRFNEPQVAGNDDGLAIDDVSFSAEAVVVPEPASVCLLAVAAIGFLGAERRAIRRAVRT
ncbi:MAG TPA: PEP-CTERM sorting domain-containing protein [Lacipirellulaceae bacterium]|jgi:hypothetical protein|nr:PEP-CTERM sorting domain-containing protein [Lacipirellulaceae bacterium]